MLLNYRNIFGSSLDEYGNLRLTSKSGNVRKSRGLSYNFWKFFGKNRMVVGNLRKIVIKVVNSMLIIVGIKYDKKNYMVAWIWIFFRMLKIIPLVCWAHSILGDQGTGRWHDPTICTWVSIDALTREIFNSRREILYLKAAMYTIMSINSRRKTTKRHFHCWKTKINKNAR